MNAAREADLGTWVDDYHWGQMAVLVHTDNNAYAYKEIRLQAAAVVNVTAAALFSNTKYATLRYGMESSSTFSHTVTFNVAGTGISIGYSTSVSASRTFGVGPGNKRTVERPHYVNTYWDDRVGGVVKTGITQPLELWDWGLDFTQEYIDPNDLNGSYVDFTVTPGDWIEDQYTETDSYTWSPSLGIDFTISYKAFSITIHLDMTVTSSSGTTNTVYYIIDRRDDTNPNNLIFRVYTAGAFYDPDKKTGGMELHVWDMSGAG